MLYGNGASAEIKRTFRLFSFSRAKSSRVGKGTSATQMRMCTVGKLCARSCYSSCLCPPVHQAFISGKRNIVSENSGRILRNSTSKAGNVVSVVVLQAHRHQVDFLRFWPNDTCVYIYMFLQNSATNAFGVLLCKRRKKKLPCNFGCSGHFSLSRTWNFRCTSMGTRFPSK